jgi:GUN4-like
LLFAYLSAIRLRDEDYQNFPREELRIMDQLWVKYSKGKFGFSVQKQIWLDLGGKLDRKDDWDTFVKLGERVGWKKNGKWLYYSDYDFSTNAPNGHLPCGSVVGCAWQRAGVWWDKGWMGGDWKEEEADGRRVIFRIGGRSRRKKYTELLFFSL